MLLPMRTEEPETARCVGARCGDPANLRCPICGVRLCHACAREHCDSQSPRCSPAAADPTGTEPDIGNSVPMLTAGAHTHRIGGGFGTGGDKETRPTNVAVQYIIKL